MIDNFNGERVNEEDCSDEELAQILADTNKYYPADRKTGYGYGDWETMRDQADTIEREIEARERDAREEDRQEMREDDERVGL